MNEEANKGSSLPTNGASQNGQAPPPSRKLSGRGNSFPEPGDEVTLRELGGMLWEGKWIIIATALAVLGIAATYTYSQTPIFQTSSAVFVDRSQRSIPGVPSFAQEDLSSREGPDVYEEVFILNRSKEIRRNVALRLDTMAVNPYTGRPPQIVFGEKGSRRSVPEIVAALREMVWAEVAGEQTANRGDYWGQPIGGITISASSPSPDEAALLANLYAEAYVAWTEREVKKSARSTRTFLEKQAERFRTQVQQVEQKLETFMQEQGGVGLDQRTNRAVEKLASLQSRREELKIELNTKRAKLKSREEELARVRPKLADRLSSGVGSELARVQKQKAEVKAEINQVRRRNPDLDPSGASREARALARLKEREARLEREADSLAKAYVDETLAVDGVRPISGSGTERRRGGWGVAYIAEKQKQVARRRIEISGLEAKLRVIKDRISEYQRELDTLPVRQMQLAQIQRDRRAAEDIYGFVRERLQETRIAEESEVAYAEVLEPAGIPLEPVSPNTRLNLVLGLFLGLLGGIGLVFLREALSTRLQTPDDLEELGDRVLGVIPSMDPFLKAEFDGGDKVEIGDRSIDPTVVMLTSPKAAAAEAYRQLQVDLCYVNPDAPIRSLIMTSPERGEGKTTTSLNLAIAAARSGRSVALVDADLRNPQLHTRLDAPSTPGLTEALYDTASFTTMGIDNLILLTSGDAVPNPSELLGSQRMDRLVTVLEEGVDLVIIDTPPTLPFSDSTALLPHTDGALLVASANETDRRAYERARSKLESVGHGVIGSVLNRFDAESRTYGYYYKHYREHYDYAYGYENGSRTSWLTRALPS